MRKLSVFNNVSIDGFFVDANNDMSWAHGGPRDAEFDAFVQGNAGSGGTLLFGRVTYELMASYWPSPAALQNDPKVAEGMNRLHKVVFSRTLCQADWQNTTLIQDDMIAVVHKMKQAEGPDMTILGSGTIVSQLTQHGLIDQFCMVVNPLILGKGRSLFEHVAQPLPLRLTGSRVFKNGKIVLNYQPA